MTDERENFAASLVRLKALREGQAPPPAGNDNPPPGHPAGASLTLPDKYSYMKSAAVQAGAHRANSASDQPAAAQPAGTFEEGRADFEASARRAGLKLPTA